MLRDCFSCTSGLTTVAPDSCSNLNVSSIKFSNELPVIVLIFWRNRWRSIKTLRGAMANSSEIFLLSCFKATSMERISSRRVIEGTLSRRQGRKSGYNSSKHWRNLDSPSVRRTEGVNASNSLLFSHDSRYSLISCVLNFPSELDLLSFCINEKSLSFTCFI